MSRPAWHPAALLRAPLLHFLLLGGLAFALRPSETPALVVGVAEVEELERAFQARESRAPTRAEADALRESAVDEALLLREAARAGWLVHDGTVVRRLLQLGRFVGAEGRETPPELAVARARELGLDRSDPVIRRYLLERARLALAADPDRPEPSDAELEAHRDTHAERFRTPERLRLVQVFVRGGPDAEARAADLADSLAGSGPDGHELLGDAFPRGRRVVATREGLARDFGAAFAAALDPTARGRWQGPVPSAHGLHLVYLEEVLPARDPGLDEVRGQVRQSLLEERRAQRLRARLDALRAAQPIVVE